MIDDAKDREEIVRILNEDVDQHKEYLANAHKIDKDSYAAGYNLGRVDGVNFAIAMIKSEEP